MDTVVIDIGSNGQRLRVVAGPAIQPVWDVPLRPLRIEVEADPFRGTIESVVTDDDLNEYLRQVEAFRKTGHAALGGHRAPFVEVDRDGEAIEVTVQNTGDDPWPSLRYLIFPSIG